MLYSVFLYFFIAFLSTFIMKFSLQSKSKKINLFGVFLTSIILGVFSAYRGVAGMDTINYIAAYEKPNIYFSRPDFEIGFKVLMYISYKLHLSTEAFLGLFGFLVAFLFLWLVYKDKESYSVGTITYIFVLFFFYLSFNIMRQSMAMVIGFMAVYCYYRFDRKIVAYILVALAMSMHITAIIMILPLVIYYIVRSRAFKPISIVAVILALYYSFNPEAIAELIMRLEKIPVVGTFAKYRYISFLLVDETSNSHQLFVLCIQIALVVGICTVAYSLYKGDEMYQMMYIMMIVGYIIRILGIVTGTQIGRVGYYYSFFECYLFGLCAKKASHVNKYVITPQTMKFFIILIGTFLFAYQKMYRNYGALIPYGIFK